MSPMFVRVVPCRVSAHSHVRNFALGGRAGAVDAMGVTLEVIDDDVDGLCDDDLSLDATAAEP
eukprot:7832979-Pyramimonas_sp.AAC.2